MSDRQDGSSTASSSPSRRSFLQGLAGGTVGAAGLAGIETVLAHNAERVHSDEQANDRAAQNVAVELKINGKTVSVTVPDQRTLLLALREDLGLTGTKKGCNFGQCGACTVLMDGEPVYSCFTLAEDAVGREITTIEGLEKNGILHPVQQGFIDKMGSQCGMCTTGMIMCGAALLNNNPSPTADEVRFAILGVLCRCGNYPHEVAGILAVAQHERPSYKCSVSDRVARSGICDEVRIRKSSHSTPRQSNRTTPVLGPARPRTGDLRARPIRQARSPEQDPDGGIRWCRRARSER